jgi:hypothetical protein
MGYEGDNCTLKKILATKSETLGKNANILSIDVFLWVSSQKKKGNKSQKKSRLTPRVMGKSCLALYDHLSYEWIPRRFRNSSI